MPTPEPEVIRQINQTSFQIIFYVLSFAMVLSAIVIALVVFMRGVSQGLDLLAIPFERIKLRQKLPKELSDRVDLLQLSSREFEMMVVELYHANGHPAERTGATGDHGVDVVIHANNGEKWVAQCKRWRGTVGEPVVRDFYGVMQHEKADKGAIITSGKFTLQAREWAKGKPIILYDGDEFLQAWKSAKSQNPVSFPTVSRESSLRNNPAPICPKCGAKMVLRTASRGMYQGRAFYGCSNYPKCKGIIQDIEQ